jgi:small subunit ribosomal protein S19e
MQNNIKQTSSMTLRDIPASIFISTYANFLKNSGQLQLPSWIEIIKSGSHKIYSPLSNDWIYFRLASLVRRLYINGGQGVGKLRKIFGGKKRRGSKPSTKKNSGGKVVRLAYHELERLKIIEKDLSGKRYISKKARKDIDIRSKKIFLTLETQNK